MLLILRAWEPEWVKVDDRQDDTWYMRMMPPSIRITSGYNSQNPCKRHIHPFHVISSESQTRINQSCQLHLQLQLLYSYISCSSQKIIFILRITTLVVLSACSIPRSLPRIYSKFLQVIWCYHIHPSYLSQSPRSATVTPSMVWRWFNCTLTLQQNCWWENLLGISVGNLVPARVLLMPRQCFWLCHP